MQSGQLQNLLGSRSGSGVAASPDSREPGSVRFPYDTFRLKVSYGNRTLPGSRESGDEANPKHA